MFITFEGGEGSGKSTQSVLLAERLKKDGHDVVLTREPGGTEGAESIRELVLKGDIDRWDSLTESLLFLASRSDHWQRVIKPSLDAKKIVICDRFHDSTIAYQGHGKGVDINFLNTVYKQITGGVFPDRTYLLFIEPKVGLTRSVSRENNDEIRFERMKSKFHEAVWKRYIWEHFREIAQSLKDGEISKEIVENLELQLVSIISLNMEGGESELEDCAINLQKYLLQILKENPTMYKDNPKNSRFWLINGDNSIKHIANEIYEDFCKIHKVD